MAAESTTEPEFNVAVRISRHLQYMWIVYIGMGSGTYVCTTGIHVAAF